MIRKDGKSVVGNIAVDYKQMTSDRMAFGSDRHQNSLEISSGPNEFRTKMDNNLIKRCVVLRRKDCGR